MEFKNIDTWLTYNSNDLPSTRPDITIEYLNDEIEDQFRLKYSSINIIISFLVICASKQVAKPPKWMQVNFCNFINLSNMKSSSYLKAIKDKGCSTSIKNKMQPIYNIKTFYYSLI